MSIYFLCDPDQPKVIDTISGDLIINFHTCSTPRHRHHDINVPINLTPAFQPSFHPTMSSPPGVLCTSFNQDSSLFAVGLPTGFRIYTSDPLRQRMRRDFPDGGIGIIELVERTNWIALVGGGREPKFPQNKVSVPPFPRPGFFTGVG